MPGASQRRKVTIHVVPTVPVEEKETDKKEDGKDNLKSDTNNKAITNMDEIDAHLSEVANFVGLDFYCFRSSSNNQRQ